MACSKVNSLKFTLQDTLSLDDREWSYSVPGLPGSSTLRSSRLIKLVTVVSNHTRQEITLRFVKPSQNRAIANIPFDGLISIGFADFRLRHRHQDHLGNNETTANPVTAKESADYVTRLLQSGLTINGVTYNFYGHSNSQLKSRTCYLLAATKEMISRKVDDFGDFSKSKSVGKKAKRIGLLFSTAEIACDVPPGLCEDMPDIVDHEYNFTDGCGLIQKDFAAGLVKKADIKFRNHRYTPSVFQIRYRGYKGVLTTVSTINGQAKIKFRDSMKKFKGGEDHSFSVIDYAKPYVFGYLNDEVVLLLHTLGISECVLRRKQQEYFDMLSNSTSDARSAFRLLTYTNNLELAERVLLDGTTAVRDRIVNVINQEFNKLVNAKGMQKCRIMIPQSRLLFGVCDPDNVLQGGECAVKVTLDGDGQPRALKGMEILVTRNPCLHPGDLQKFRVVEKPELSQLVDCIVFPVRGRRPSADMMSGGDLDGDKFFVCWDSDLVPTRLSQPARHQGAREPVTLKPISDDDRLQYFARYTNASLGRVKNLYLDWARAKGPMSGECQELNHLFSRSVDGNSIKIPKHLEDPSNPEDAPFVLDILHTAAKAYVDAYQSESQNYDGYTFNAMQLLLSREDHALSEFELIKLTHRWCIRNGAELEDWILKPEASTEFAEYFDFNGLTDQEKAWTLDRLSPSAEMHSQVLNGLLQSNLVASAEIHAYGLDHPSLHWKRAFDSEQDRMATFLETTSRVLHDFAKKIILLKVDERLTLAIYVPRKVESTRDCQVDDTIRLFAFPHSQKNQSFHRCVVPTKKTYRLYCDEHSLQLYQGHRRNTWVFITQPGANNITYKHIVNEGEKRRQRQNTVDSGINTDFIASVALDKFSKGLQTHIGRVNRNAILAAELYVISNRDLRSLQALDLWLKAIDTEEVMPLFESKAKDYTVSELSTVDWANEPEYLITIVRDGDFQHLKTLKGVAMIDDLLEWLWRKNQPAILRQTYDYLLSHAGDMLITSTELISSMVRFLRVMPSLAITFSALEGWTDPNSPLHSPLVAFGPKILFALVAAAQEAQELVVEPFRQILHRILFLPIADVVELVKIISLGVRSSDVALDLLLGVLEPESARILRVQPNLRQHFLKVLIGLALDHVEEAGNTRSHMEGLLELKLGKKDRTVSTRLRIDAHMSPPLQLSDHVRLTTATPPCNSLTQRLATMDAIITTLEQGQITFECFHPIPSYVSECSWKLVNCGSFVTTQTMLDATYKFAAESRHCCPIQQQLLGMQKDDVVIDEKANGGSVSRHDLNESQNTALNASLSGSLTLLWGPPGTGKSHTIVAILQELLASQPSTRILVAAPTHNAVDNVMRKYVASRTKGLEKPVRVSTDIRKVADDMKDFTCDAMVGKELREDFKAQKVASKRIREARLVFTTCIGAALGLLRNETFQTVIIDEASQQTEPMSLVPLVKGCTKAILVGDHVQLRATVQPLALLQQFEISLFERLYQLENKNIKKVMLDAQYRMHREICNFSSEEFYESRLTTAVLDTTRPLSESQFAWPPSRYNKVEKSRMVFVQCSGAEDIGQRSKSNPSQVALCSSICAKLLAAPSSTPSEAGKPSPSYSIAVLTPYTRQGERLRAALPSQVIISSIDGFQGREADIIVFVTVRCNVHAEIGFLQDLRRLNVVMTRAKSACIVLGDRETLTKGSEEDESKRVWRRLIDRLVEVKFDA